MTLCKIVLSMAVLLAATAPLASAQGTYTQIDYPGALLTQVTGVDSAGDVVGTYLDSNDIYHGFILSGGVLASLDSPGSINTLLGGINDMGQIVGSDDTGSFLYDTATQVFTPFSFPGANTTTVAEAINNVGTIVGHIYGLNENTGTGFQLAGTKYTKIAFPNSHTRYTFIRSINDLGQMIGYAISERTTQVRYFSYFQGKFSPVIVPGITKPTPTCVNNSGAIGGIYISGSSAIGFIYEGNNVQQISFPGVPNTYVGAISNSGEVGGTYADSNEAIHGFTWTPPAAASERK